MSVDPPPGSSPEVAAHVPTPTAAINATAAAPRVIRRRRTALPRFRAEPGRGAPVERGTLA
ncbi:hypothetical protein, partial [Streptomyces sp. MB09-02B]|uniref:hypothetical protein n=1 Tax=Streptomyces sp. MB09-02B TaxID=3028667 RepID=UPI0029B5ED2F